MSDTPLQAVKKTIEPVELTYLPPKRSWRRRMVDDVRSWARNTFSRESYVSSLKSLLWVVPLTVLIWIYAESEQEVALPVVLHVQAPGGETDRVVRLGLTTIHAEIKARQADIEQVRQWIEITTVALDVDHALPAGDHQIDVASQLNKLSRVKESGATITNCEPSDLTISIDPIKEADADVVAARSPETIGLQPPVFTPPKVRIRGPASEIDGAARAGQLVAYANLSRFAQQLAEPGIHELQGVPLSAPPEMNASNVRFSQPTVMAHVEVPKTVQQTVVLNVVTVFAAYPEHPKADQWRARYNSTINQVAVTGPVDQVAPLKREERSVLAYFPVYFDNPDVPHTSPLTFDLPPGVRVSNPDAYKAFTYTLESRTPADH